MDNFSVGLDNMETEIYKGVNINKDANGHYHNKGIVYKFPTLMGIKNYIANHLRNGTAYVNERGNLMFK